MKIIKTLLCVLLCATFLLAVCACDSGETKTFAFSHKGTEIAVNADAAPILAALEKELVSYDESPSCAFQGLDKVYTYPSFEIQTYPMGGKDYVYMIQILNDLVATPEGIRIGSTRDEVIAAFGDADSATANSLTWYASGMRLEILLKNDSTVYKIRYWKE